MVEGLGELLQYSSPTSKAAPQSERADWDLQILLPKPHGLPKFFAVAVLYSYIQNT
jgi:hypothetical protein